MQHIIETSIGNRTLVEIGSDCDYVTPMIAAFEKDVDSGTPEPGFVAIRPLGDVDYEPFVMHADELKAESARRKAVR